MLIPPTLIYAAQGAQVIELRDATWSAYVEHQYTLADNWPELVLILPVLSWP
jgi:hypothetical protein